MNNFANDRHALYCGWILGIALKQGLHFRAVADNEGNFTDRMELALPGGYMITVVIPPPPDDWWLE